MWGQRLFRGHFCIDSNITVTEKVGGCETRQDLWFINCLVSVHFEEYIFAILYYLKSNYGLFLFLILFSYDAIISGCLQWENNKKKTRLPFCTSEKGWKLLEDIMYMMEWNDRQEERWRSLTVWNDDDKEEEEDNEEVKVTKKKGLILEGEALETTQQEEGVRGQNETAGQCEEKPSVKTTKRRPHVVDHAGVDDGDSEDDNNDVYDDKNDNDWTPQEQISEDEVG